MKCESCKHCELESFDSFKCEKQPYIRMTSYGVFQYERSCVLYEAKEAVDDGKRDK